MSCEVASMIVEGQECFSSVGSLNTSSLFCTQGLATENGSDIGEGVQVSSCPAA